MAKNRSNSDFFEFQVRKSLVK